ALLLQLQDLRPLFHAIQSHQISIRNMNIPHVEFNDVDPNWIDHLAIQDAAEVYAVPLVIYALEHKKTIGPLIAARASGQYRKTEQLQLENEIRSLELRPRILYFVGDEILWEELIQRCEAQ